MNEIKKRSLYVSITHYPTPTSHYFIVYTNTHVWDDSTFIPACVENVCTISCWSERGQACAGRRCGHGNGGTGKPLDIPHKQLVIDDTKAGRKIFPEMDACSHWAAIGSFPYSCFALLFFPGYLQYSQRGSILLQTVYIKRTADLTLIQQWFYQRKRVNSIINIFRKQSYKWEMWPDQIHRISEWYSKNKPGSLTPKSTLSATTLDYSLNLPMRTPPPHCRTARGSGESADAQHSTYSELLP